MTEGKGVQLWADHLRQQIYGDDAFIARMQKQAGLDSYEPASTESPQKVAEFVRAEIKKWGDLVKSAGLKGE